VVAVGWVMRAPTAPRRVTDEQRVVLEKLIRSQIAAHRDVQRAWVLLMACDGFANTRIAEDFNAWPSYLAAAASTFSLVGAST